MNTIPEIDNNNEVIDPLPDIEDALLFFAREMETPPVLVEGLLHKGSKLVLGGSSKSMKTWTLLDLGLSVATGADWWGRKTTEGRVLYVNFEIPAVFFRERMHAILQARELKLRPGEFDVWNLRGFSADASVLLPQIIARVKDNKYALIVLDPIYKCLGGRDENKAGDIASLMNLLDKLAVISGAAVVFGAHFSKGNQAGKESIDRIGGSGVFGRDPDSILVMTQHKQKDVFAVHTTLRSLPFSEPFCVKWKFPLMEPAPDYDPAELKKHGSSSSKIIPALEEMDLLFPKKWPAENPRKGLLSSKELGHVFDEKGFDKGSIPEIRDELEKKNWIRVLRHADGNQTLAGSPKAVAAYEQWVFAGKDKTSARRGRKQ